jgi:hypothetical protein
MPNNTRIEDKRPKKIIEDVELFRLSNPGDLSRFDIVWYYFCLKAITGDKMARDLVDVAGIIIYDIDGNQIYPKVEE